MQIIKRSEASELYPDRYEIQIKISPTSAWKTVCASDTEEKAIRLAEFHSKFSNSGVRVLDNDN